MKLPAHLHLIALLTLLPVPGIGQTGGWNVDLSLYGVFAGMSGNVAARGIPADIDIGFKDIWENLQAGAMGRVTVRHRRWALSTDVIYMGLGAVKNSVDVGVDQWMVQPALEYRASDWVDVFAGARYNNLNATIRGPMGREGSGTQEWWDPVVGAQFRLPLTGKLRANVRGDVGGFGAGSTFTWQLEPLLIFQLKEWMSMQAGYRWLDTDYETGTGNGLFRYDVLTQGPQFGVAFHF